MAILAELKDPRVQGVTVTGVEVSPDMRQAKVHVSIMGNETRQRTCLAGLQSSAGYLQSKIAERIDTRYTPRLQFVIDLGVKKSIALAEILNRVLPKDAPPADDTLDDSSDADEFDDPEFDATEFDDAADFDADDSEKPDSIQ